MTCGPRTVAFSKAATCITHKPDALWSILRLGCKTRGQRSIHSLNSWWYFEVEHVNSTEGTLSHNVPKHLYLDIVPGVTPFIAGIINSIITSMGLITQVPLAICTKTVDWRRTTCLPVMWWQLAATACPYYGFLEGVENRFWCERLIDLGDQ